MSASAQMEPALILHVRPYQESSAIVQMLTLGQGRLAGVLRGLSKQKKWPSRSPALQRWNGVLGGA